MSSSFRRSLHHHVNNQTYPNSVRRLKIDFIFLPVGFVETSLTFHKSPRIVHTNVWSDDCMYVCMYAYTNNSMFVFISIKRRQFGKKSEVYFIMSLGRAGLVKPRLCCGIYRDRLWVHVLDYRWFIALDVFFIRRPLRVGSRKEHLAWRTTMQREATRTMQSEATTISNWEATRTQWQQARWSDKNNNAKWRDKNAMTVSSIKNNNATWMTTWQPQQCKVSNKNAMTTTKQQ